MHRLVSHQEVAADVVQFDYGLTHILLVFNYLSF